MSTVLYTVEDKVARVVMNRPDKLNAIDAEMRNELYRVMQAAKADPDVWIIVLTGAGKSFSVGHDLSEVRAAGHGTGPTIDDLYLSMLEIYKPIVAAIPGYCLAQGGGLALCSDIRISSTTARFGWPQVKRGISSISGPSLLAHFIPINFALGSLLTGELIDAAEAYRLGMLNQIVAPEELDAAVDMVITQLRGNAPLAMRAVKEATLRGLGMSAPERVRFASLLLEQVNRTEDAQEGIAAFLEKRAPIWKGA
ncbi:MAG: enoyl-CoA hydratase/isomerase family protein [Chloroflexi bacterium]|nr:enoyl-CoA hydratase/isomerase family protein [Chloroflexota bacterium]